MAFELAERPKDAKGFGRGSNKIEYKDSSVKKLVSLDNLFLGFIDLPCKTESDHLDGKQ